MPIISKTNKQTKNTAITPFYLQDPGQCPQPSQGFGGSLPAGLDSPFISSLISHVQMGLSLHFLELILILLCPSQLSFSIFFFNYLVHADLLPELVFLEPIASICETANKGSRMCPQFTSLQRLVLQSPKRFTLGAPSPFLYMLQTTRGRRARFSHERTTLPRRGPGCI